MKRNHLKTILLGFVLLVIYQNCGPAQIKGDAQLASADPSIASTPALDSGSDSSTSAPPSPAPAPAPAPTSTTLFGAILENTTASPGQTLKYTLKFSSPPLPRKHRIYVHFVNPATGNHEFQDDFDPSPAVTLWNGEVLFTRIVTIPSTAAASKYSIRVGIYDPFLSADSSQWTSWPVQAGTGATVDSSGKVIVGSFSISRTIEGEHLTISSGGGRATRADACVISSPATGDIAVMGACLWGALPSSVGEHSFTLSESGNVSFQILASGTYADGAWPEMEVFVTSNGVKTPVGRVVVKTTNAADSYLMTANLKAGTYVLSMGMLNDYYDSVTGVDRNLFVEKIRILP